MKLGTLVIIGAAVGAALGRAIGAPFPGMGENPYLDLIAHHDPGIHTVIRVWYTMQPRPTGFPCREDHTVSANRAAVLTLGQSAGCR